MNVKTLFIVVTIFASFSCSKDLDLAQSQDIIIFKSSVTGPENENNSKDSTGYYHNRILEEFFDLNVEWSPVESVGYVSDVAQEIMGNNDSISDYDLAIDLGTYVDSSSNYYYFNHDSLLIDLSITGLPKSILNRVFNLVNDTTNSYGIIYDAVVELEDSIINNSFSTSLTSTEKEYLLQTTSVCRFSTYFWKVTPLANTEEVSSIGGGLIIAAYVGGALVGALEKDCDGFWNKVKCAALGAGVFSAGMVLALVVGAPMWI